MKETGTSQAVVLVCITCRAAATDGAAANDRAGAALADATGLAALHSPDVRVRGVRCLANCSRGPSAAIRCADSWTYVFGQLAPQSDGPALVAGARLLAQADDGIMPWKGRPDALKRGLIARVPPPDYVEDVP